MLRSQRKRSNKGGEPDATYRLQFNRNFPLESGRDLIPYLRRLGISHVYSSPLLEAKKGSLHGYDVTSHSKLNGEICSIEEFQEFAKELKDNGMSLILDIVPNHMAADVQNEMWEDILRNGRSSRFADYFDIYWKSQGSDKIVLPILTREPAELVASGKLFLSFDKEEIKIQLSADGQKLPVSPRTFYWIFRTMLGKSGESLFDSYLDDLENQSYSGGQDLLSDPFATRPSRIDSSLVRAVESKIDSINREPEKLLEVLKEQNYKLEFWVQGLKDLNYRRFFNVADLVAIREENPSAFNEAHDFLLVLISRGFVQGLRIDHPDGLWDPTHYFSELSSRCRKTSDENSTYLVVEKILSGPKESLPRNWKVSGTTGYDFLRWVNGLLVANSGSEFKKIFRDFVGVREDFKRVSFESKLVIVKRFMRPDVKRLVGLATKKTSRSRKDAIAWKGSIELLAATCPIYRTYLDESNRFDNSELKLIQSTIERAEFFAKELDISLHPFTVLRKMIRDIEDGRDGSRLARKFFMGFQQLSSAVVAKGVEDTAFYRYFPLSSLNEVGGSPDAFGASVVEFHNRNRERLSKWPHSMLATSTHDTKRGEDTRTRIDCLSEIPGLWENQIKKWRQINDKFRRNDSRPSRSIEYLFYQTVLGCLDISDFKNEKSRTELTPAFVQRMVDYTRKASREAKMQTSWILPDKEYEKNLEVFVRNVLSAENSVFLSDLLQFSLAVRKAGRFNSLSQLLLKLTSPGVPDFYQGTELWDYSLVDPDNRRPVDFKKRSNILYELEDRSKNEPLDQLALSLLKNPDEGEIKLFIMWRVLNYRRHNHDLFWSGTYHPVAVQGSKSRNAISFLRLNGDKRILVIASRFFFSLLGNGKFDLPIGDCWDGTFLRLPKSYQKISKLRNVITGEEITALKSGGSFGIELSEGLKTLPVALFGLS